MSKGCAGHGLFLAPGSLPPSACLPCCGSVMEEIPGPAGPPPPLQLWSFRAGSIPI